MESGQVATNNIEVPCSNCPTYNAFRMDNNFRAHYCHQHRLGYTHNFIISDYNIKLWLSLEPYFLIIISASK